MNDWGELIPHLAHDARALVRKGLLNTQLLQRALEPSPNQEVATYLGAILESQTDLNRLLLRMVAFADAQNQHRPTELIDLRTALLGAILECRKEIEATGAKVERERTPSCMVPKHMQIVLRELIDNALRFRDPARAPLVVIEGTQDHGRIRIQVSDNGTGLDAANAAGLFEPLQRLDAQRSGFGLGLAISRSIVEKAGGRIYNLPADAGATFGFELRLTQE